MLKTKINLHLKTAAKALWIKRDFFVEDGDYDIVLDCLIKLSEFSREECIAALDEYLNEEVYN